MDYEEKLRLAKEALESGSYDRETIEYIFPELKESNDEEIRKVLIDYLKRYKEQEECGIKTFYGIPTDNILAWLEKQGKVCHSIMWHSILEEPEEMQELLCEWESDDATWHEVAFYHADTKTFWNGERQVEDVIKWIYINELLEKQGESSDKIHYWTEEEIEPIISDYLRGAEHYGGMICRLRCLKPKSLEKQGEQKVTTVDFKAKDWYVSKVDGKIHNMTYNPTDKVEPNPTWSEADERNLKSIMKIIKEKAFADYDVDEDNNMLGIYGILESWLKSLKPQPQWKPSEEQIQALEYQVNSTYKGSWQYRASKELLEQLKKL